LDRSPAQSSWNCGHRSAWRASGAKQGKRGEARDLLASIYGWFTEGFGTPVLEAAKALLEELTQGGWA
jgi:hypothetical protein